MRQLRPKELISTSTLKDAIFQKIITQLIVLQDYHLQKTFAQEIFILLPDRYGTIIALFLLGQTSDPHSNQIKNPHFRH